jgi:hypothetical protein
VPFAGEATKERMIPIATSALNHFRSLIAQFLLARYPT